MLLGEHPGKDEDLAGMPFVGPAGRVLDTALQAAGLERDKILVSNAVKHFKFAPRGKRRLHQRPNSDEIAACRVWNRIERDLSEARPDRDAWRRGAAQRDGACDIDRLCWRQSGRSARRRKILATIHPSYLLRPRDESDRVHEPQLFIRDLRSARDAVS